MIKTTKYTPGFLNTINRNIKILKDYKELLKLRPASARPITIPKGRLKKKKVGNPQ